MGRVQGKVALVTGGASGIGRACCIELAREGARVVVTDVQDDMGEATVALVAAIGGAARYERHDVTSEERWAAIIDRIRATEGMLHILVNNAGIAVPGPVTEMTLADWRRQQAVNVDGVFLGVKHALPLIRASGGGAIVNISSVAGLRGAANASAYCASKGAVRLFTKAVALECAAARDNVRVNSVHPGIIDTPIWATVSTEGLAGAQPAGANAPDVDAIAAATVPTGLKGLPEDVARGVLYLASDDARYVNGAELVIDSGLSAR